MVVGYLRTGSEVKGARRTYKKHSPRGRREPSCTRCWYVPGTMYVQRGAQEKEKCLCRGAQKLVIKQGEQERKTKKKECFRGDKTKKRETIDRKHRTGCRTKTTTTTTTTTNVSKDMQTDKKYKALSHAVTLRSAGPYFCAAGPRLSR